MDLNKIIANAKGMAEEGYRGEENNQNDNENDKNQNEYGSIIDEDNSNIDNNDENGINHNDNNDENIGGDETPEEDATTDTTLEIEINGQTVSITEDNVISLVNTVQQLNQEVNRFKKYDDIFGVIASNDVDIEPDLIQALIDAKSGNIKAFEYLTNNLNPESKDKEYRPQIKKQNISFDENFNSFWDTLPYDFKRELSANPQGKELLYKDFLSGYAQKVIPMVSTIASLKGISPVAAYIEVFNDIANQQGKKSNSGNTKRVKTKKVPKSNRQYKKEKSKNKIVDEILSDDKKFEEFLSRIK